MISTGVTSGHGPFYLRGANIPVTVGKMNVAPGEIIHMDHSGACKFPARYLPKVLEYAKELIRREANEKEFLQSSNFSLKNWKNLEKKSKPESEVDSDLIDATKQK